MVKKNINIGNSAIIETLKEKKLSRGQIILLILSLAICMLAYTWKHVEMNKTLRNIEDLKKAVVKQEQLNEMLKMELAKLEGFKSIQNYATEELNLEFPEKPVNMLIMDIPELSIQDSLILKYLNNGKL